MSSPFSSLKKGKRSPLDGGRRPRMPFRQPEGASSLSTDDLDEIPEDFLRRDVISRLPRAPHKSPSTAPTDQDLLSSVMGRLSQAENQLKFAKKEVVDKDKRIKILEEKVKLLERSKGYSSGTIAELEKRCKALQRQVYEMEGFLEDYGMVWVGAEGADSDYEVLEATEPEQHEQRSATAAAGGFASQGMWKPGSSVVNDQFRMDFDRVIKNIEDLNILAGEGCAVVAHGKDGARLKVPDPVPLTLFCNGIVMFAGPFRPYSDPTTQQCMNDLMDGYFPSELQSRYPDGTPIKVTDKREVAFQDKRTELLFPGTGISLGSQKFKDQHTNTEATEVTSDLPNAGNKETLDHFLSRIPQSVIRGGKIVDVRGGLTNTLKGDTTKSDVLVLETAALGEIKSRADENAKNPGRPMSASSRVTTLRIKTETGDKTYVLKMKFHETIADVRRHVDAVRSPGSSSYELKTSFPNRVYDDPHATLQDCGLVPNATLHLLVRKAGSN